MMEIVFHAKLAKNAKKRIILDGMDRIYRIPFLDPVDRVDPVRKE